jgi:hypothetical protein
MSHRFNLRLIPGVLGLVLALQGISEGGCLHGWGYCGYCNVTTTTSATPMVLVSGFTAPPVVTQHPAASLGTSSATPPAFASPTASFYAPASPYYGVPNYAATPSYAIPAYSYAAASPTYGYASVGQQSQGLPVASTSYLSGYNPSTPSAPVAPGTPLTTSHLFGSHIKQSLHTVASSIGNNKGELLQAALKIFGLASGFFPGGSDIEALINIVDKVIAERQGTKSPGDAGTEEPADNVATKVKTTKDKANVVHVYITLTLPPGVEGKVEPDQTKTTEPGKKTDSGTNPEGNESPVDVNKPGKMNAPAGHP